MRRKLSPDGDYCIVVYSGHKKKISPVNFIFILVDKKCVKYEYRRYLFITKRMTSGY